MACSKIERKEVEMCFIIYIMKKCDRTWEKGPIGVVDHFLFFYTFGTCDSLPHYGYLSER